jgi:hypothetical protein
MADRAKAAAYHGIQNVKFATKTGSTYATPSPMLYAKSLSLNAQVQPAEQYADNRLLFRVPSDQGYEGELGTTAPDAAFEIAAGFTKIGQSGVLRMKMVSYARGALYYEHVEHDENGAAYVVKTWAYNVEIGKGSETHATDEATVSFGDYSYPLHVYGDPTMTHTGDAEYIDANGLKPLTMLYSAWPDDAQYATFGDAVPVPKMAEPTV